MAAGFLLAAAALLNPVRAQAPAAKPNILFIMGDDIGFMQPHITHSAIIWANPLFGPTTHYLGQLG
jgi:hypothetical protein